MTDTRQSKLYYDVFNGDADGICALHQLRLAEPRPTAGLISGVKRDIRLLRQISSIKDAFVTVLDISLASNREDLESLLANNCRVFYVDHHFAGSLPDSPALTAHIDPGPDTCTSLIIDRLLGRQYPLWAVTAAFGDNLHDAALQAAARLDLSVAQLDRLRELGELLNYNSYGLAVSDLHFPPLTIYEEIRPFSDPFEFCRQSEMLADLRAGYDDDLARANKFDQVDESSAGRIYMLPSEPWARRVSGVFSNEKARQQPGLAHALLVENHDGTFLVSVRAPLASKTGADKLCLAFPTGGGRAAAAGINALPREQLADFINSFKEVFSR